MSSNEPIRLTKSDLYSPQIESYLDMQRSLRRDINEPDPQPLIIRVIYSSWFYLAIASACGALVAWASLEPFFDDNAIVEDGAQLVANFLLFPTVAGCIGLFLGAAEGLMCRNAGRALRCGAVGLGVWVRRRTACPDCSRHNICNHDGGGICLLG